MTDRIKPADETVGLSLLHDSDRVFAALEACTLSPDAAGLRRMSWDDLAMARAITDAEGWSRPLRVAVARALRSSAHDAGDTVTRRQAATAA